MTRAQIRTDLIARLTAAGIVPAGHVLPSRTAPVENDELPALIVYALRQTDKSRSLNVPAFARSLDLAVEVVVAADTDNALDDALDALCLAVETSLLTDDAWIAQFERIEDVQTEIAYGVEAGKRRGAARIVFRVTYHVEHVATVVANAVELDAVHVTAQNPNAAIVIAVPTTP